MEWWLKTIWHVIKAGLSGLTQGVRARAENELGGLFCFCFHQEQEALGRRAVTETRHNTLWQRKSLQIATKISSLSLSLTVMFTPAIRDRREVRQVGRSLWWCFVPSVHSRETKPASSSRLVQEAMLLHPCVFRPLVIRP
jgi:hypothetical protein